MTLRSLILIFFFISNSFALDGVDCSIVESGMLKASAIRGLDAKKSVACKLQNKQEVEKYLRETIGSKISKEKIKAEGDVFKILGFIPEDFDYLDGIISMYLSQLGGYYDSEKDYYAMASWMPYPMQLPIAIHELTHALQDQYFNLEKFLDHKKLRSDELLAASALIEGDATAVMLDFSRSLLGLGKIEKEKNISGFMFQNLSGLMFSEQLKNTPASLQSMMIFPYVSGLNFAHSLLQRGSYAEINKAFLNPPRTTEQILHPEIFLSEKKSFEELSLNIKKTPIFDDRLGEFYIATLLKNWLEADIASAAAAGWGGDRVVMYDDHLLWKTRWDTKEDSIVFFNALTAGYEKRFKQKAELQKSKAIFKVSKYKEFFLELNSNEVNLHVSQ